MVRFCNVVCLRVCHIPLVHSIFERCRTDPKNACYMQESPRYLLHKQSFSRFCLKCRCRDISGYPGENSNDAVKLTDPEKYTIEPKNDCILHTTGLMTV